MWRRFKRFFSATPLICVYDEASQEFLAIAILEVKNEGIGSNIFSKLEKSSTVLKVSLEACGIKWSYSSYYLIDSEL